MFVLVGFIFVCESWTVLAGTSTFKRNHGPPKKISLNETPVPQKKSSLNEIVCSPNYPYRNAFQDDWRNPSPWNITSI